MHLTIDDGNGAVTLLPPAPLPPAVAPVPPAPVIPPVAALVADRQDGSGGGPAVNANGETLAQAEQAALGEVRAGAAVSDALARHPLPPGTSTAEALRFLAELSAASGAGTGGSGSGSGSSGDLDPAIAARMRADEAAYLARYPDVAAAVARGTFSSGRDHFDRYGRAEGRIWGVVATTIDTGGSGAGDGGSDTSGVLGDERTLESAYKPPGVVSQWRNLIDVFKLDVPQQHNAVRLANAAILQVFK